MTNWYCCENLSSMEQSKTNLKMTGSNPHSHKSKGKSLEDQSPAFSSLAAEITLKTQSLSANDPLGILNNLVFQ